MVCFAGDSPKGMWVKAHYPYILRPDINQTLTHLSSFFKTAYLGFSDLKQKNASFMP